MLEIILWGIVIYMALVGASVTCLALIFSKWYVNKCKKMIENMMGDDYSEY